MGKTLMPVNIVKNQDWILHAYEDMGVELADGFQKDVIQNAIGASSTKKYTGWKCKIDLIHNEKGHFIVVEDEGCTGLTGPNLTTEEINTFVSMGKVLDDEWRLARFSSLNNSSSTQSGAGLFGVGKTMYSIASSSRTYYFDSLREDGLYVANSIAKGMMYEKAFENEDAKNFIFDNTGLGVKVTHGTRIIIADPLKEISDSFSDGTLLKYIQETWWRKIQRMKGNAGIYVNNKLVTLPKFPAYTHSYELSDDGEEFKPGYKVKHFGFYIDEKGKCPFSGIAYYRKGMKIGSVDLKDLKMPDKLAEKYWAYIEVDSDWEKLLADIEDNIHYGVSKKKRNSSCYIYLRNFMSARMRECLIKWGYIKENKNADEKLNSTLKNIAQDLEGLFAKLNYSALGLGVEKKPFDIRLNSIKFPVEGTAKVTTGDSIGFSLIVKNQSPFAERYKFKIMVKPVSDPSETKVVNTGVIDIEANAECRENFSYLVDSSTAIQGEENEIIIEVNPVGKKKKLTRQIPFCFDCDKVRDVRETVLISLNSCLFPRRNSKRVNGNESLSNVVYRIENRRNEIFSYKLALSLLCQNGKQNQTIYKMGDYNGVINPFEEQLVEVGDIFFDKSKIEQYLDSGILEVKAQVIANADSGDDYMKGDKITKYQLKVFYNRNEKNGFENSFEVQSVREPDNPRRSWCEINGSKRTIALNIDHIAYQAIGNDEDMQESYCREQMLKQFIILYLKEGKYDILQLASGLDINDLSPAEVVDEVMYRIDYTYTESLR